MVPDTSASTTANATNADSGTSTVLNVLVGGVVGIVLSVVPGSTLLGGAVAGYLEDGTERDGITVGALAGLVMLVPFVLIGFFVLFLLGVASASAAFGLLAVVVLFVSALYTVGLSALGGYLGTYLVDEL